MEQLKKVIEKPEDLITIPRWKMIKIEDVLRQAFNIHHSSLKETCFDRSVCKAWAFAGDALKSELQTLESQEVITTDEDIFMWATIQPYKSNLHYMGLIEGAKAMRDNKIPILQPEKK